MRTIIYERKSSNLNADHWFIAAYIGLYLIPFIILLYQGEFDLDEPQTREHLIFALVYFISYLASGAVLWLVYKGAAKPTGSMTGSHCADHFVRNRRIANMLAMYFGWLSVFIIALYYAAGGYKKIFLLGSDVDAWTYRLIGYDDVNRVLSASLEVARRILMPYAILTKLLFRKYHYSKDTFNLSIFIIVGIFGAIVNLDRGPIFLYVALFFFYYSVTPEVGGIGRRIFYFLVFIFAVGVIGGTVTLIQYNIVDIDFASVYGNFIPILLDRIMLDPVRMAELYSFGESSLLGNPLYLQHSRLGALFGAPYVGTDSEYSIYVTPVGLIGDVWRNFGMPGAIFIGLAHGLVFKYLSRLLKKSDISISLPIYFLFVILTFYLFYSGIFSQGPIALLCIIFIMARLIGRNTG